MRPRSTWGATLAEVLVSGSLALLVLGTVGAALRMAYRAYGDSDREMPAFRRAVEAVGFLAEDLAGCGGFHHPSPERLRAGLRVGEEAIVWRARDGAGREVVVAYLASPERGRVMRRLYALDDGPPAAGPPESSRPLPEGAEAVLLRHRPGRPAFVELSAEVPGGAPVATRVAIREHDPEEAWP